MKTIILIILLILAGCKLLFAQSNITYSAGSSIDIGTGADICADAIIINGTYTGGGTICSGPLPVLISSFTFSTFKNNISLSWTTEAELNNSGFEIERAAIPASPPEGWTALWVKIGFVRGHGTTNEPQNYNFEDKKLNAGKYNYRLKQIDYIGNYEYFSLEDEVIIAPPVSFNMGQNYPNPSNPKSKIEFEIPVNGKVVIRLYNLLGQEVKELVNEVKDAGYYSVEFDGTALASGVYFYRITAEGGGRNFTKTLKLILVK